MKRSHYIIGGLALAISMPSCLQAQTTQPKDTTMTRTVVVEQEYNPDIMDASKVNVLPKVEEPTVSKKEVEYATTFFPATSVPAGLMRPYTGKEVQPGTTPGYVRAGYGNYGNLDVLRYQGNNHTHQRRCHGSYRRPTINNYRFGNEQSSLQRIYKECFHRR